MTASLDSTTTAISLNDTAYSGSDDISLRPLAGKTSSSSTFKENEGTSASSDPDVGGAKPVGRPRRLPESRFWRNPLSLDALVFIGDVLLTLCPCLFLALAFGALAVHNQPLTSPQGQFLERAAGLAPTIFPIIFAAICGRLMRAYALWRAEKGEALGIIEQLNGSQSLFAALERATLIPGLGPLSTGIVLLWLLSPIGGQSGLRVLSRGTSATTDEVTIYYFNTTGGSDLFVYPRGDDYYNFKPETNSVFQAVLASLERVKGRDVWGNVKIPVLQYLASHSDEHDGWLEFNENEYREPYSALSGLLISGLKDDADFRFTLESSYFNLTCAGPEIFVIATSPVSYDPSSFIEYGAPFVYRNNNASLLFASSDRYGDQTVSNAYMVDTNYNHSRRTDPEPRYNYIYASMNVQSGEDLSAAAYNCTVGITHVENDLLCEGRSCRVLRLRPSRKATPNHSGWPWPEQSGQMEQYLLDWMNTAASIHGRDDTVVSAIDAYISGSNNPFAVNQHFPYDNITGGQMERRLQSLVNTGWQLLYQGVAIASAPTENFTALDANIPAFNSYRLRSFYVKEGVGYPVATTTATKTTKGPIFVANRIWVSLTIAVSFILLFCGVTGIVLKYLSHSPDILGFVSSMTRDNPNFEQIAGSDRMDGLQRARAMKHVRVQIVDVAPWDEGHIILTSVGRRPRTVAASADDT